MSSSETSSSAHTAKALDALFHTLPPDAQRAFLDTHLLPLLPSSAHELLTSTAAPYVGMPSLDLKHRATVLDRVQHELDLTPHLRENILDELVDLLARWVEDVWCVVAEYRTSFWEAHRCLLIMASSVCSVCDMFESPSSCSCLVQNVSIDVAFRKRKADRPIKTFQYAGLFEFVKVLFWTWREVLVTLLSEGGEGAPKQVEEMLDDICTLLDWHAIQTIVLGGRDVKDLGFEPDFDGSEDDEGPTTHRRACPFHATHWSAAMEDAMLSLRQLVTSYHIRTFSRTPSAHLFRTVQITTTTHPWANSRPYLEMLETLDVSALTSSDAYSAALEIHADVVEHGSGDTRVLKELLENGRHLLRPSDAPILIHVVLVLSLDPSKEMRAFTHALIRRELLDIASCAHDALLPTFVHLTEPANQAELKRILSLRKGDLSRENAIAAWIKSASTPGGGNSIAAQVSMFANFMGLPVPFNDAEDDQDTAPMPPPVFDGEEIELLKERWEQWLEISTTLSGTSAMLIGVAKEVRENVLRWIEAEDVVDALSKRLDARGREAVGDVLSVISSFMRKQRQREREVRERQERRAAKAKAKAAKTAERTAEAQVPKDSDSAPKAKGKLKPESMSGLKAGFLLGSSAKAGPSTGTKSTPSPSLKPDISSTTELSASPAAPVAASHLSPPMPSFAPPSKAPSTTPRSQTLTNANSVSQPGSSLSSSQTSNVPVGTPFRFGPPPRSPGPPPLAVLPFPFEFSGVDDLD